MDILECGATLLATIKHNLRLIADGVRREEWLVPMFWSEPGIGKTEEMRRVVRALGNYGWQLFEGATEDSRWRYADVDLQTRDSGDLGGNPWVHEGRSMRMRPDWMLESPMTIYALDEIAQAQEGCHNIAGTMINEGRIGEHKFHPGSMFVGASNPAGSRTGTVALPGQLRSRMVHYDILPNALTWASYAATKGVNPYIIAYTRYRALGNGKTVSGIKAPIEYHHKYDPLARSYPCARGWTLLNGTILMRDGNLDSKTDFMGCVGDAAATDFMGFVDCSNRLPDLNTIISSPGLADLPDSLDTTFVVMQALAARADSKTFGSIVTYLKRIREPEFAELCIADATTINPSLKMAGPYADWKCHLGQDFQQAA